MKVSYQHATVVPGLSVAQSVDTRKRARFKDEVKRATETQRRLKREFLARRRQGKV